MPWHGMPCHACRHTFHLKCTAGMPTSVLVPCHAQIVKELVPLLEKVVAADYPLWRAAGAAMDAARQDGQEALSTGGASGPAFKQTMGQGGVSEGMLVHLAVRRWSHGCPVQHYNSHRS